VKILKLSKFDVAERQLLQAIQMFFREDDPVSIHTVVEAAAQVLSDIGADMDVFSNIRNAEMIREEKRKEWFKALSASRNFFKHADRDKNSIHEFNPETNCFSIIDALMMYQEIKKVWTPETIAFHGWFFVSYPDLIREGSSLDTMYQAAKTGGTLPNAHNKRSVLDFILMLRSKEISMAGVTLERGL